MPETISDFFNDLAGKVVPMNSNFSYTKTDTLLKVEGIKKAFGDKIVLNDVSFEIKDIIRPNMIQGQISSIVGLSGQGKSTLFSIMAGLLKQDAGNVLVSRKNSTVACPVKRGDMGVVFQDYYVYEWRKVIDIFNLSVKKNSSVAKDLRRHFIDEVVMDFELEQHLNKYPSQLSGGQKQRVAIAEQLLNGGNFILFDEPFSGLDSLMIDKVMKILLKVANSDELKTLIIVSHDLSNCVAISDTVFILGKEDGKDGAFIKKEIDLIERQLAWHENVKENPVFIETLKEIKSLL